ncbi:hypothetical protein B566_EDAN019045 [Ephemera danica]|nr:hypothetical protein B566_EDAN019045 [Ephemera danica]
MDGLETLAPNASSALSVDNHHHLHHLHHHPHLQQQQHLHHQQQHSFNVLCFDTSYKEPGTVSSESGGSPIPASTGVTGTPADPTGTEPAPGDLNTPVTTSGDIPTFFGPSTVVEPPPITDDKANFGGPCCHGNKRQRPAGSIWEAGAGQQPPVSSNASLLVQRAITYTRSLFHYNTAEKEKSLTPI